MDPEAVIHNSTAPFVLFPPNCWLQPSGLIIASLYGECQYFSLLHAKGFLVGMQESGQPSAKILRPDTGSTSPRIGCTRLVCLCPGHQVHCIRHPGPRCGSCLPCKWGSCWLLQQQQLPGWSPGGSWLPPSQQVCCRDYVRLAPTCCSPWLVVLLMWKRLQDEVYNGKHGDDWNQWYLQGSLGGLCT